MKPSEEGKIEGQIAGGSISATDLQTAAVELCRAGLLTCARGEPGEPGSTYAVSWLPLDNPDHYSPEIRAQHAENMRRVLIGLDTSGD